VLQVRKRLSELKMDEHLLLFRPLLSPAPSTCTTFLNTCRISKRADGSVVDLAAIDILRVRERGVPRYNQFRRLLQLTPAGSFEELTDNPAWAEELRRMYGDVERVDLMVGLYAEPKPKGFGFSDTAFRIFILMASRRLESDRFFSQRDFRPEIYNASRYGLGHHEHHAHCAVTEHFPSPRACPARCQEPVRSPGQGSAGHNDG